MSTSTLSHATRRLGTLTVAFGVCATLGGLATGAIQQSLAEPPVSLSPTSMPGIAMIDERCSRATYICVWSLAASSGERMALRSMRYLRTWDRTPHPHCRRSRRAALPLGQFFRCAVDGVGWNDATGPNA